MISRQRSLVSVVAAILVWTACLPVAGGPAVAAEGDQPPNPSVRLRVYFGTYTNTAAKSRGIYLGQLDLAAGKLQAVEPAGEGRQPLLPGSAPLPAPALCGRRNDQLQRQGHGRRRRVSIQPKTGKLTALGQQSSGGGGPCHVLVDPTGRCVLAANYGSGSVACLPIQEDGSLGAATSVIQHSGSSLNPQRQKGPHAHGFVMDCAGRIALAADLGLDKILIYRLDAACGKLSLNRPALATRAPGPAPGIWPSIPTAAGSMRSTS